MPRDSKEFIAQMNRKQASLLSINQYLRQGCEFELATRNSLESVRNNLANIGLGSAENKGLNTGNGWNRDTHADGGSVHENDAVFVGAETSTSPFHSTSYRDIKAEFEMIMPIYERASNGLRHSYHGSTHVHTAIAYANFYNEGARAVCIDNLPTIKIYRNLGALFVRFMPVLKWLSMTCAIGARAAEGNTYDTVYCDNLYSWHDMVIAVESNGNESLVHNDYSDDYLCTMSRDSMFRVHGREILHFENRMMDACWSATMMAAWFCLNRAATLFAYDMARNGFQYAPTRNEVLASRQASRQHTRGYRHVSKQFIVSEYAILKSMLYKYFKVSNSLDAIDVLDKLIDCPIPQYLESIGLRNSYDVTKLEGHFHVRLREKDEELRDRYIQAIKQFVVPHAESLDDFHMNVAAYLGVQKKQAISLYQMFKRENVDLEFSAKRLIYMGE